jgi:hypothetical protein
MQRLFAWNDNGILTAQLAKSSEQIIERHDVPASMRVSASKTAPAAREAGVVARIERSSSATAWLWGLSLAVLVGSSGLFLVLRQQTSAAAIEKANANAFAQDVTASIILNQGSRNCQHKLFDNRTGRFSDAATPCPGESPLDANGNPIPSGTAHTINEISKSFR